MCINDFKNYQNESKNKNIGIWKSELPVAKSTTIIPKTTQPTTKPSKKPIETQKEQVKTATVYITETGSKYHCDGCRYLSKSKIAISLENAKKSYEPCSVCNPPR